MAVLRWTTRRQSVRRTAWPSAPATTLFAGGDSSGKRANVIYSLVRTIKMNGVDPELGLHHVLTHISNIVSPTHCTFARVP